MRSATDPRGTKNHAPAVRLRGQAAAVACVLLAGYATAVAQPAAVASDKSVDAAIRRGVQYLYDVQKPDGSWETRHTRRHPGGAEALIVLTVLSAGERPAHRGSEPVAPCRRIELGLGVLA